MGRRDVEVMTSDGSERRRELEDEEEEEEEEVVEEHDNYDQSTDSYNFCTS